MDVFKLYTKTTKQQFGTRLLKKCHQTMITGRAWRHIRQSMRGILISWRVSGLKLQSLQGLR